MSRMTNALIAGTVAASAMLLAGSAQAIDASSGDYEGFSTVVGSTDMAAPHLRLSPSLMVGLDVVTNDGVEIGTVEGVADVGGVTVLVVTVAEGALSGVTSFGLSLSDVAIVSEIDHGSNNMADARYGYLEMEYVVEIQTDSDDLSSSVAGAM